MSVKRLQLIALVCFFYISFAALRILFAPLELLPTLILAPLLVWITIKDLERYEIPDVASFLLAISGLALTWSGENGVFLMRLAAGLIWAVLFWGVGVLYLRARGTPGLGFGDVKLMVGIGIWLGFVGSAMVVFAAALSGVISILVIRLNQDQHGQSVTESMVAFGPFLCLSTWVVWLLRDIV